MQESPNIRLLLENNLFFLLWPTSQKQGRCSVTMSQCQKNPDIIAAGSWVCKALNFDIRHLYLHAVSNQLSTLGVFFVCFNHVHDLFLTSAKFQLLKPNQISNKHLEHWQKWYHDDEGIRSEIWVLTYFAFLQGEMLLHTKLEELSEKWRGRVCGHCHHLWQTCSCV